MIGLDNLMKINGVIAAGQFDQKGNVIRKEGQMSEVMERMTAKMAANNNKYFEKQIDEFSERNDMNWKPLMGWAVWGGKYSIVVVGRTGVFTETAKTNFNQLMEDLLGEEPTGARQINI